jgi:endonuclease/exonuclease/phosphatase family metal-dependent hydrolase
MSYRGDRTTTWMRYVARTLTLIWAGWWIFFGVATVLSEEFSPTGVLVLVCYTLIFLVSAAIPWFWEAIGAVALVCEGLIVLIGYPLMTFSHFPPSTILLVILTMALPPLVAGFLFLTCWHKSKPPPVRKKWGKIALCTLAAAAIIPVLFLTWVWSVTFHPAPVQPEPVVCSSNVPVLKPGQKLKVLTWNVQYMAGKNYVFYYDVPDNSGPDRRPSPEDITKTLHEVARIIRDEQPDIILLQEVDDGAKRTDYEDQQARLLSLLPGEYGCHASAFYWKASFLPHPCIMGSVGMKLSVISKYKISEARRHQLPLMPKDPLTKQFNFKRAVLEVHMPIQGAKDFIVMNTHLDAFAQGTNTMVEQIKKVLALLEQITHQGHHWIIGGDFNLLPPGKAYSVLSEQQKIYFQKETELEPLFKSYQSVPSLEEANSPDYEKWFTHFPNDSSIGKPNKTIDYIFLSNDIRLGTHYVRQHDTLRISDHLPVVAEFRIPEI